MKPVLSEKKDQIVFLYLTISFGIIPLAYFFNQIVTEYYYSKGFWGNLLLPIPFLLYFYSTIRRGEILIPRAYSLLPLFLFLSFSLLSLAWAPNVWKGIEIILKIGGGPFAYFLIPLFFRSIERLKGALYLILWSMFGVSLFGFGQYFEVFYLPRDQYGEPDPSTTIGLTNFVMDFFIQYLPVAPFLFFYERRRWVRLFLLISFSSTMFYAIIARNRAAFLGILAESFTFLFVVGILLFRYRERLGITPRRLLLGVTVFVAGMIFLFSGTVIGRRMVERFSIVFTPAEGENDSMNFLEKALYRAKFHDFSTRFRVETWYQCVTRMFPDRPLFGDGLGNAEVLFPLYYTPFLEEMTLTNNTRVVQLHNEYVQALTDLGIVGLLLFLLIHGAVFLTAVRTFRLCKNFRDLLLWFPLNIWFPGFMMHMFFTFPLQIPTSGTFFFITLGFQEAYRAILEEREGRESTLRILLNPVQKWAGFVMLGVLFLYSLWIFQLTYRSLYAEVRNKEARVFKQYQQWDEAYTLLTDAIAAYPYMEGYYYDRAVVLLQMGRTKDALEDLKKTRELVPYYAMGRQQIGLLAFELGQPEVAVEEFKMVMRIYRTKREDMTDLIAKTAFRYNRPDLAIPVLEEGISQGITKPEFVRYLADLYLLSENFPSAISYYNRLRGTPLYSSDLRTRYAFALFGAGDITSAEKEIRDILLGSENAEGWYLLGKISLRKGDIPSARNFFEKAIHLEPKIRYRIGNDPDVKKEKEVWEWILKE